MSKPVVSKDFSAARAAKPLTGKVALVTGGSRGIGAAIAKELADQGADVAVSYAASADKAETVAKELKSKGVRAAAFKADQADAKQVEDLVKSVAKEFGRLDILVNNAGVFAGGAVNDPTADLAALEREFAVNVGGVAAAVRAAVQFMGEGGRDHHHRLGRGRHDALGGRCRLFGDEGRRRGLYTGLGAGPRPQGHHRKQCAAGTDRHRHVS